MDEPVTGSLGHRNEATALNVYSHFVPEADRHAAAVIAALGTNLEPGAT
jgi:hypothetical protein